MAMTTAFMQFVVFCADDDVVHNGTAAVYRGQYGGGRTGCHWSVLPPRSAEMLSVNMRWTDGVQLVILVALMYLLEVIKRKLHVDTVEVDEDEDEEVEEEEQETAEKREEGKINEEEGQEMDEEESLSSIRNPDRQVAPVDDDDEDNDDGGDEKAGRSHATDREDGDEESGKEPESSSSNTWNKVKKIKIRPMRSMRMAGLKVPGVRWYRLARKFLTTALLVWQIVTYLAIGYHWDELDTLANSRYQKNMRRVLLWLAPPFMQCFRPFMYDLAELIVRYPDFSERNLNHHHVIAGFVWLVAFGTLVFFFGITALSMTSVTILLYAVVQPLSFLAVFGTVMTLLFLTLRAVHHTLGLETYSHKKLLEMIEQHEEAVAAETGIANGVVSAESPIRAASVDSRSHDDHDDDDDDDDNEDSDGDIDNNNADCEREGKQREESKRAPVHVSPRPCASADAPTTRPSSISREVIPINENVANVLRPQADFTGPPASEASPRDADSTAAARYRRRSSILEEIEANKQNWRKLDRDDMMEDFVVNCSRAFLMLGAVAVDALSFFFVRKPIYFYNVQNFFTATPKKLLPPLPWNRNIIDHTFLFEVSMPGLRANAALMWVILYCAPFVDVAVEYALMRLAKYWRDRKLAQQLATANSNIGEP